MSLLVHGCASCGHAVFPPRLLCPRCGGRDWRDEQVDTGVLEAVGDRGEVVVGAVRTAAGPLVIARVERGAQVGAEVSLAEDEGVPVARA